MENKNRELWAGKPPKPWAYEGNGPKPYATVGTMMPVQRVTPGAPSRRVQAKPKMSPAEMELDSYCREADRYPELWPLHEPCFYLTECPECGKEAAMALNDYICVKCRCA